MNEETKVLKIGTKASFGEKKEIKSEITAITIREYLTIYEITYWKVDEQKTIWLNDKQIKILKKENNYIHTIGFIDEETT